jgi:hypothetical protein
MNLLISEILNNFEAAKTKQEKLAILKQNDTPVLRTIMRLNFDPKLKMDLPEGEPPYKKDLDKPIGYHETNLIQEYRRFYIWLTPQTNLPKFKKETLFVSMLEGLHWSEAEVLVLAKDGKLSTKFKSLKEDMVREVYLNCLSEKEKVTKVTTDPLV